MSIEMCLNNDEEDTIVGNFTSKGIGTLHVEEVMPDSFDYHNIKYLMVSSNNYIPVIELYGIFQAPLKLVNEGRLEQERNLRSGYLQTQYNSQWRQDRSNYWEYS